VVLVAVVGALAGGTGGGKSLAHAKRIPTHRAIARTTRFSIIGNPHLHMDPHIYSDIYAQVDPQLDPQKFPQIFRHENRPASSLSPA
jgi:hypothetical protein